jgi:hypothetical protein
MRAPVMFRASTAAWCQLGRDLLEPLVWHDPRMRWPWTRSRNSVGPTPDTTNTGEVDDRTAAAFLAHWALVEIRHQAVKAQQDQQTPTTDALERIRFLANLAHDMPLIARPRPDPPAREEPVSPQEAAMAARPLSRIWDTCGPQGRTWMIQHIESVGYRWTPPPPPPLPHSAEEPT